jgi:hypothetical protein
MGRITRILIRRAGKGWAGQPMKRADGKCVTRKSKTAVAETSGQKAVVKKRTESRTPQILKINNRIPYYKRCPQKPLVKIVKVKCPICGVLVRGSQVADHKLEAHAVYRGAGSIYRGETPTKCQICGVSVKPKRMVGHLRKVHAIEYLPEVAKPQPTQVRLSKKKLKSAGISSNSTRRISDTRGKVVLISRRGTRIKDGQCAECGKRVHPCWKYAISNRGPVFLCGPCKPEVFERSFGFVKTVDALDIASRGGGFETNRRKH